MEECNHFFRMPACDECGKSVSLPYECRFCGYRFCSEHRLPENHSCEGLEEYTQGMREEGRMFKRSEPVGRERAPLHERLMRRVPVSLKGNVALSVLAAMLVVYLLQLVVLTFSRELHSLLFVLGPEFPTRPWTVVTSLFSHDPTNPMHLFVNGLVLFFFGPTLERMIGSREFAKIYFVAGFAAGLGFVAATGASVLGASGAIFGVMGTLTMLRPNMRIYLNFLIPMPLWLLTIFYALISIVMIPAGGARGVADLAHLIGLVAGLVWGQRLKGNVSRERPERPRFR
ncbi:MAG: Rhomboid protease GlpG [Methanonatronarchaeales archaeon]|nr:Rhomboid protease GlpG [Methanonatronarchaeales archaeon]